uniref:Uncharacterized protein n=1 Tax=Strongyloides stercoralis TaxID=6248 RepID=A0AAF5DJN1_STRER
YAASCATFLLLIRTTFEPQFIGTFVVSSIVNSGFIMELYWEKLKAVALLGSDNEEKDNNADYDKEFMHYYCCIGGCCSTGTKAWRFFWRKLEDMGLLELNLKHGAFFLMGEIYLLEAVALLELYRKRVNFFLGGIHSELMLVTIVTPGCCSTGTDFEALRLFWKELKDVPILQLSRKHRSFSVMGWSCCSAGAKSGAFTTKNPTVVEGIGGCCSTGALSKTCKLFFGRNSFRINASYDSDTRYYCCCFGGCCSTGTDSEALKLFRKKLEDVPILQLSRKHRSFSVMELNANYDGESSHCYRCFGGCCSTGTGSEALKLLRRELKDVAILINASYDNESSLDIVTVVLEATFLIGTESGAWRLFWRKLADVVLLQLNLEYGSSFVKDSFNSNANFDKEPRNLLRINAGYDKESSNNANYDKESRTESEAWDDHFWSEQEAAVLLELDLKDENSPGMKWRLIETVSKARRFSRNRLGAVVPLRLNLNMAVSLEQTRSCGLY